MYRKKTADPRLIALADQEQQAREAFERWYGRMRRAVAAMEKARHRIVRLQRLQRKLGEAAAAAKGRKESSP